MRNHFRPLPALATLAACLSASSCIDGNEQITIEPDGSGRASLVYHVPSLLICLSEPCHSGTQDQDPRQGTRGCEAKNLQLNG